MNTRHRRRRGNPRRNPQSKNPFVRTIGLIAAGIVALGGLVTAGILIPESMLAGSPVVAAYVYTAADAETAAYGLPISVGREMAQYADDGDSVLVFRIEGDCKVKTTTLDMTPRTDSGEVLNVPSRIKVATQAKIDGLVADMNTPTPGTDSRCLYVGLSSARIPHGLPVYVFSSGIDLTAPTDFRDLAWETSPEEITEVANSAKAVPDLKGADVEFFLASPTASQEIRAAQTEYLHSVWSALLVNAGASSVTFTDGVSGEAASTEHVPVVPLPDLPGTPVPAKPNPVEPDKFSCTFKTTSGFVPDTAKLLDEDAVRASLADCVSRIAPGSSVRVDGWVAYYGLMGADGTPAASGDVKLSQARAEKVKSVLVTMGVPGHTITTKGWGAVNQPDPRHPTAQSNRVCVITVTPPTK